MLNKNDCVFKRGGMCTNKHGIVGTNFTVVKKVWSKLKNGIYGYKSSKVVRYRCKHDVSNNEHGAGTVMLKGVDKKTSQLNLQSAHISASKHHIFKIRVPTPHNIPLIMWGRHKNFKDLMYRS